MKLHDYQRQAVEHILTHKDCALFLDCGLGKTAISLSALADLVKAGKVKRALVVAPLRVAKTVWAQECEKWGLDDVLKIGVAVGSPAKRLEVFKNKGYNVVVVNRENVVWLYEMARDKELAFNFDTLIVDELSSFKSTKAKRWRALKAFRPLLKRTIGLTGTPASNGLIDLWAQFKIIDGGVVLGNTKSSFISAYFSEAYRINGFVAKYNLRVGAEDAIYKRIEPITLSMRAVDKLDMPELVINDVKCCLSPAMQATYKELAQEKLLVFAENAITTLNAAACMNKLLQLAGGAVYNDDGAVSFFHEEKLEAMADLVEAANGKNVLIAYWFKFDEKRIKDYLLDKLKIKAQKLESEKDIADWNAGKIQVGLIHPASAGHGLNLQDGGNTLIWYSIPWSLELYQQTNARLYRQGQKSKTVFIHHIFAEKTVDEKVLQAVDNKAVTQEALLDALKIE